MDDKVFGTEKRFLGSLRASRAIKNWSNLSKKNSMKNIWLGDQLIIFFFEKVPYFLKFCPIFVGSVHNFGKFDNNKI